MIPIQWLDQVKTSENAFEVLFQKILGDALPQISDVTGVVAFLCGPESKFINGAIIPIDGGYNCN